MENSERKTLGRDWYKNSKLWKVFAPLMFGPERWAQTPAEVTAIIHLLGLRGTERILDACCGVGRHSLEFAVGDIPLQGSTLRRISYEQRKSLLLQKNYRLLSLYRIFGSFSLHIPLK